MTETRYDVVGIGNALVDVLVEVDDDAIAAAGMAKGGMTLVERDQSDALYDTLPPGIERSGGSCGNTMAGLSALGGKGAYIGKVRDDQFGDVFRHDMKAIGVDFVAAPAVEGPGTGKCLVMVTPDAQRTMVTYLGTASDFTATDVTADTIAAGKVVYLEGYLFDRDAAKEAFAAAADAAHAAGREVALTLSDSFCVDRHRDAFLTLVKNHVDILFANEDEIVSLYQAENFDDALQHARRDCRIACLTRSEKGSVVISRDEVHVVDAEPVQKVVDTTGAGDQYAAGFLYGYTQGHSLADSARIGGIMAAEVISHYGARPEVDVAALVRDKLGV
ncbi:MAG: adenosine kinase [Alphaproteobacteria bacterium]|nr:adenosine kinase [Alphaproteobacteria bacterium]